MACACESSIAAQALLSWRAKRDPGSCQLSNVAGASCLKPVTLDRLTSSSPHSLHRMGNGGSWKRQPSLLVFAERTGTHLAETSAVRASGDERLTSAVADEPATSPQFPESDEEVSAIMEGVSFAQLCDDFECISSPAVERTARQLARDIHDIREDKRSLGCFAVDVKYKDPLRSFTGREKYRRQSWILNGLEQPRVNMMSMEMLSTCLLVIRWRLRGDFRMLPAASAMGAKLDLVVISNFTLNQISGQVVEQRDEWDLSRTPLQAVPLFYSSRLAWSSLQAGKDLSESLSSFNQALDRMKGPDSVVYRDPSGDPRKFFVQEDPNRELYQFAFAVALLYLLVQFLRQVL